MRIGIDVRPLQFDSGVRGIGDYVRTLLKGLNRFASDAEFHLVYFASYPIPKGLSDYMPAAKPLAFEFPASYEESLRGVLGNPRVQHLPLVGGKMRRQFWDRHRSALSSLAERAKLNVFHATAPFDLQVGPVSQFSMGSIVTFHDAIPLVFKGDYYDDWHVDVRKLFDLQRQCLATADKVVAVSNSAREDAIRYMGVSPDRAITIYNSLDDAGGDRFEQAEVSEALSRLRLRQPFFLFCSVADWHKNIRRVIEALRRVQEACGKPYQLAVVGSQFPHTKATIREHAFDNGLTGKDVVMTGFISNRDLRILFSSSAALMTPSLYEGFGLPALYAMSSGSPVIASNRSSQPEVVGDAGILVDPESTDEIVAAMLEVVENPAKRGEMVHKGKERAKLFSQEIQSAAYMEAYRSVAR